MEESTLEILKKDYAVIQKKYELPNFDEMNKDFYIERVSDNETDLLVREVRKFVADRLFNHLRFIESLLNPQNVPMFIFSMIKALTPGDKKRLEEMYKKLSQNEIDFFGLNIEYNEEKEIEFIKKGIELWNEVKKESSDIVSNVKEEMTKEKEKGSRGYFG